MKFFSSLTTIIFTLIAFIILIIFNIKMWTLDREQEKKIAGLQDEIKLQQKENVRVKNINDKLAEKINGLKTDTNETIEEEARTNFGMVKKDETYYYIEDENKKSKGK